MTMFRSALLAATSLFATAAAAQDAAPQDSGMAQASDIIVTARRREEALQDVPISITAVSGDSLARSGVSDALGLQSRVPSLSLTNQGTSRNELGFAIRGQRTQESQLLTDPPVGTYFAEVVQARSVGFAYALYDLQSTQVLKGVQGTLFGRNMTGGAVLIEPNKPVDDFHAELRGQIGNYDMRDIYGMVNLPLTEGLGVRFAGKIRKRDGFTRDVLTGRDYDDQDYQTFRTSIRFAPTPEFESNTIVDYIKTNEHGTALVGTAANPAAPAIAGYATLRGFGIPVSDVVGQFAAQQARPHYRFASGSGTGGTLDAYQTQPFERLKNRGVTNRTTYSLDTITFKNIVGYRKLDFDQVMDLDGVPAYLINSNRYRSIEQFSEEFQIQGKAIENRLDYVLGAYYFVEKGKDGSTSSQFPELAIAGSGLPLNTPAATFLNAYAGSGKAKTFALFAAGTYAFTDQFKVSAGIRYTTDKRNARIFAYYPNLGTCLFRVDTGTTSFVPATLADCPQTNSKKWDAFTWDVTLQYEPNANLTTYISTRRGFRSGGFSLRAASTDELQPFDPETVQEYEVGLKTRHPLGGATLTSSLAIFYQDYKNVQKQTSSIDSAGNVNTIIDNTARQKNYGGELELGLIAGPLNISAFYSYVGVEISQGRQPGEFALVGSPHHQMGANVSYEIPLSGDAGAINLNANVSYRTKQHLDKNDVLATEPGYELVNLRAGWDNIFGTGLGAAAFVNNLTKSYYRVGVIGIYNEAGYISSVYGEPRTYGMELSYKF
ncbi:TonB-dependent receptor [Sphingobium fuliginis]|jgi:iron complex outermembrane receptor protein|uniref:TonB-dependent receptor n=2 Tax=Sphingobium fuliginis (strain ATCC 27551) TaxID=336203 RepID=A0A7M2GKR5_SPHSA|nr:TonB-dependent receptor [Sphingobium fuliginis]QOT73331.1 TonB-dependent receptor [Sphingobium fuliginis]